MKKLVVWGGTVGLESHRWIHRAFYETARKMGIQAIWVAPHEASREHVTADATVIAADIWSEGLAPVVPGARYVLHNFTGTHPVFDGLEMEKLIRLQVWTNEAVGEELAPRRQWLAENHTLFQPWGCDLLPEEFLDPAYNPQARDVTFVGAIWSDFYNGQDLGNFKTIESLQALCATRSLRFRHLTHVSDRENVAAVREARLAPAFAGNWQVQHGYLPCRAFKNPAYGALSICNVPEMMQLYGAAHPQGDSVEELLDAALHLRRAEYLEMVREQQLLVGRFTYRESLQTIDNLFAAMA